MDWDDYRYFLTLAREGSVRGAAAVLGVNPSTVTRRLDQFEQSLGVLLFTRSVNGLRITPEGAEVVEDVSQLGDQLAGIESSLKGRDQRLEGRIRMAVPDFLTTSFLLEDLAPFAENYPQIDLELIPHYELRELAPGQVDLAIRATNHPPEHLIGRPLCTVAMAAYGSAAYVAAHEILMDHAGASWIDWSGGGEVVDIYASWREAFFSEVHVSLRCNQVQMHLTAVRAHMGLAILPCLMAESLMAESLMKEDTQHCTLASDAGANNTATSHSPEVSPGLVRLPHMPVQASPMLWMLTHPEQRHARRIQLLMAHLRDVFDNRQHQLMTAYEN